MGIYWCLPWDTVPGTKIDVSSRSINYASLSPFTVAKKPGIPVPGRPGEISYSVEGIWQGLKIIDGNTDFSLFRGRPYKWRGKVAGHLYGNKILGIVEARRAIYLPSYEFYLKHHCSLIIDNLAALARTEDIYLHCIGHTTNRIDDPSRPLSHAALVVEAVRRILEKKIDRIPS